MQQTNLSDIKTLIHEYPDKMTRSKQSLKKNPSIHTKKKNTQKLHTTQKNESQIKIFNQKQ